MRSTLSASATRRTSEEPLSTCSRKPASTKRRYCSPAWCVALLALWRLSHGGDVGWAVAGGLAAGAGLLSKYAMAYLLLCAVVWMEIAPAAARRVGIAKAAVMLAIALALLAPNLGWNALNYTAVPLIIASGLSIAWLGLECRLAAASPAVFAAPCSLQWPWRPPRRPW
jgi:4-amino-4-deoxy-L-arabinose transferase-like glycosyltransferase